MTMNYLAEKRYFESSRVTVEIEDVATIDPLSGSKLLIEAIYGPDVFMIIFLISFLGAFFLTRDYDVGTMKNVVSMGHERWKIYLMKNIVLMIGTLFFVVSFIIAPVLFGSLYYGFGDLIDQEMFINLTKTIAISLMYYMAIDRKSTRLNSSHVAISYAVFCLKKQPQPLLHLLSPSSP